MASKHVNFATNQLDTDIPGIQALDSGPRHDQNITKDNQPEDTRGKETSKTIEADGEKDGMNEYAAHYREPPPAYTDVYDKPGGGPGTPESASEEADVPNRSELREPDGASGSSSPSSAPTKVSSAEAHTVFPEDRTCPERKQTSLSIPKTKSSDIEVENLSVPKEQKILRDAKDSESKSQLASIPIIPSTNIGVAFLVTLCFNLPLGAVAIYFSLMATKAYRDGKPKQGAKKARISTYISLFSIVLTVLIVMAVVLMRALNGQTQQRRYATKTSISL